jgi:hypothetical protein
MNIDRIAIKRNRHSASIVVLALAVFLTGCNTVKDAYMVDSVTYEKKRDYQLNDSKIFPASGQWVPTAFDPYTENYPPGTTTTAYAFASKDAASRNKLRDYLVRNSEVICKAHEAAITSFSAETGFTFSEVATVLGGLGALFTPASTARIFAGSSAMVNATGENLSQAFYQKQLGQIISNSIDRTRSQMLQTIQSNDGKNIDTYTAERMLADIQAYHDACSFDSGLKALVTTSTQPSARDDVQTKISSLQAQVQANDQRISTLNSDKTQNAAEIKSLTNTNADLDAQIGRLQLELSILPSSGASPIGTPPATSQATTTTPPPVTPAPGG